MSEEEIIRHGAMTILPFRDKVFGAVTASHSVILVPLADHQTVLDGFARVLSSNYQNQFLLFSTVILPLHASTGCR